LFQILNAHIHEDNDLQLVNEQVDIMELTINLSFIMINECRIDQLLANRNIMIQMMFAYHVLLIEIHAKILPEVYNDCHELTIYLYLDLLAFNHDHLDTKLKII